MVGWLYKRMVSATKNTLKKLVGISSLDFERLNTVLVEIEYVINFRPFTYMNDEKFNTVLFNLP